MPGDGDLLWNGTRARGARRVAESACGVTTSGCGVSWAVVLATLFGGSSTSMSVVSADVGISTPALSFSATSGIASGITSPGWSSGACVASIRAHSAAICSCEVAGVGGVIFISGM